MTEYTISAVSRLKNRLHQLGGAVQDAQLNLFHDGFLELPAIVRELEDVKREWMKLKEQMEVTNED